MTDSKPVPVRITYLNPEATKIISRSEKGIQDPALQGVYSKVFSIGIQSSNEPNKNKQRTIPQKEKETLQYNSKNPPKGCKPR